METHGGILGGADMRAIFLQKESNGNLGGKNGTAISDVFVVKKIRLTGRKKERLTRTWH